MASSARTRRVRRQNNAALKFGNSAKPRHKLRSGRTGSAHAKQMAGKLHEVKNG